MNTRRRAAVGSVVAAAIVLVVVAVGYPDWLWFPLTFAFWLAVVTFVISVVLEIRDRVLHV